jgi:large subunit ribosomal protein L1
MIRGSISLPKGIGKSKRVIVFCQDTDVEAAKEAGAIEAGGDELVQKIQKDNWLDFDVAVAPPLHDGQGRPPGPRPRPTGQDALAQEWHRHARHRPGRQGLLCAGKIEFRNDAGGNVHAVVGKLSFADDDLKENIVAFVDHIRRMRPAAAKGTYLKTICLSGSMTPAVHVDWAASTTE